MSRRDEGGRDFFRVLAAYFLPPLALLLKTGLDGHFLINCVLTVLGWVPGQLHALWVVANTTNDGRVARGGTWTFLCYVALVFWPVAVLMKRGLGVVFLLNLVLTLLGGVPGMLHAVWVVTKR